MVGKSKTRKHGFQMREENIKGDLKGRFPTETGDYLEQAARGDDNDIQ